MVPTFGSQSNVGSCVNKGRGGCTDKLGSRWNKAGGSVDKAGIPVAGTAGTEEGHRRG
jgi:hypothetical protein